jgi:hypothetical protein
MPRRTRRGGALTNYWNAAKAGFAQGLKNAPKATVRALKNSLKSRNSAYSSYASIANMRGSNINNIMSQHNENFRKAAGNVLRPYTLAARNKVLGLFKTNNRTISNNRTRRMPALLKSYNRPNNRFTSKMPEPLKVSASSYMAAPSYLSAVHELA